MEQAQIVGDMQYATHKLRPAGYLSHAGTEAKVRHQFDTHSWCVHECVMWGNCAAQHKATFDYQLPQRRLMHRTKLVG